MEDLWPDIDLSVGDDDEAEKLIALFRQQASFGNAHFYHKGLSFYSEPVSLEGGTTGLGLFVEIKGRTYYSRLLAQVRFDPVSVYPAELHSDFGGASPYYCINLDEVSEALSCSLRDEKLHRLLSSLSEIAQPRTLAEA